MRILAVDRDNATTARLCNLLESRGHRVTVAGNAKEAESRARAASYQLLFTDLWIGRTSGIELFHEFRERNPRLEGVVLTDSASVDGAISALRGGVIDYLRKPFKVSEIDRVLTTVGQQQAETPTRTLSGTAAEFAKDIVGRRDCDVLVIDAASTALPVNRVTQLELGERSPQELLRHVRSFAADRPRCAVVMNGVDRLVKNYAGEDVLVFIRSARDLLANRGPFVVGYSPERFSKAHATGLRALLVAADTHATIDAIAHPIRRELLRRIAEGPSSFVNAARSVRLEDRMKVVFHLKKLTDSDLVIHLPDGKYALTERGRGAMQAIEQIMQLDSSGASGNGIFASEMEQVTSG